MLDFENLPRQLLRIFEQEEQATTQTYGQSLKPTMENQEKVEQAGQSAEQRAQKKAARRAAFIQEIAEAVFTKIASSVTPATAEQPVVNIAGMWLYTISKESRARISAAPGEVSPGAPAQS